MFDIFAPKLGFPVADDSALDYLIDEHYHRVNRPFRCCQPRDLLFRCGTIASTTTYRWS